MYYSEIINADIPHNYLSNGEFGLTVELYLMAEHIVDLKVYHGSEKLIHFAKMAIVLLLPNKHSAMTHANRPHNCLCNGIFSVTASIGVTNILPI